MVVTFKDAVEDITTYVKNRDLEQYLEVHTTSDLRIPDALQSVQMLENPKNLQMKVNFIYSMLKDNGVIIKYKDKELCSFQVNDGMKFEDIEYFIRHPAIYRYFIDAIFGVFLKNSYPLLSESQEAE